MYFGYYSKMKSGLEVIHSYPENKVHHPTPHRLGKNTTKNLWDSPIIFYQDLHAGNPVR